MFKRTDRQVPLFSPAALAPPSVVQRLKGSWADGFQRHVLPILLDLEDEFAGLYSDVGRPNWSVARLVGLNLLQQLRDLDDQSVLDELAMDLRFQYALGVTGDQTYLSRRSYVSFRARLAERDPDMRLMRLVFDRIAAAAIEDLGLSTDKQRLDSTLIISNIRSRGRADLFGKTLRHFVFGLRDRWPERLDMLSEALREWALTDEDGWFGKGGADQRVLLQQRAEWLLEVIERFQDDEEVAADERYLLVARLFREHCVMDAEAPTDVSAETPTESGPDAHVDGADVSAETPAESGPDAPADGANVSAETPHGSSSEAAGGGAGANSEGEPSPQPPAASRVKVLKKLAVTGSCLQSPYDPDATYGHKGCGYHVQVTETCGNAGTEIITDFDVTGANVADKTQVMPVLERLQETGRCPKTLLADAGYSSTENTARAKALGTELYSPVIRGKLPEGFVGRESFEIDEATGQITRCPEGHAPTRHARRSSYNRSEPTLHAYFDGATCRSCPLLGLCAVRKPNNGKSGSFHIEVTPGLIERDRELERQKDPAWWREYTIRAGVEGTVSELKRPHGMGRLRVRRMQRVLLLVSLKIAACNAKRWLRARSSAATGSRGTRAAAAIAIGTLVAIIIAEFARAARWCSSAHHAAGPRALHSAW